MSRLAPSILCFSVLLTGCHHTTPHNHFPIFATNNEAGELRGQVRVARELEDKGTLTEVQRNNLQNRLLAYSDNHYYRTRDTLVKGRDWMNFSAEVAGTTLSAVSALVGDVDLKSIISTTSALTQSTKVSIDKNLYAQQQTTAIVNKMDALRATIHTSIDSSQTVVIQQYGLEKALADAVKYDDAGTIQNAIIALTAAAGSDKTEQENKEVANRQLKTDNAQKVPSAVQDNSRPDSNSH
jgi:hypothetical protein